MELNLADCSLMLLQGADHSIGELVLPLASFLVRPLDFPDSGNVVAARGKPVALWGPTDA